MNCDIKFANSSRIKSCTLPMGKSELVVASSSKLDVTLGTGTEDVEAKLR